MIIRGRDRSFWEIMYKGITFIPKRLYWYYHDEKIYREFLRVLRGGADVREENVLRDNLLKTLKRAHSRVPYWRKFSCLEGITRENVFERLSQLPLLDKDIIRSEGARMHVEKDLTGNGVGHTGGTTGKPLDFYYGRADENSHQRALYEYMTGMAYKGNLDKMGAIVGFGGTRPSEACVKKHIFWVQFEPGIYGSMEFCTLYMQRENMPSYIDKLNEVRPLVIRGYSNAILNMAHAIEEHGGLDFAPKAVYVTSEYCSLDSMKYISKVFQCPVHGQYGQNEACHFAWTKPNEDIYYCSPYYGYVEVLDDRGNPVDAGEMGELVVTAFGNDVQPFIRYRTGDLVRYGGIENGVVRIDKLVGRNNDYLINSEGDKIYASGIIDIHYLKCQSKIHQYQIEQEKKGEIIFRIVKNEDWDEVDEDEIRNLLVIEKITPDFEYVETIPLTQRGKERHIIQHI